MGKPASLTMSPNYRTLHERFTSSKRSTDRFLEVYQRCRSDPESLFKLEGLIEDLECKIHLRHGVGTFGRLTQVPLQVLKSLEGRPWIEVLLDGGLDRVVWSGIRNYARALKAKPMDPISKRTGRVLHALAIARLEAFGEVEQDDCARRYHLRERWVLEWKPYMPKRLVEVLRCADRSNLGARV